MAWVFLGDWLAKRAQLTPERLALVDAGAGMRRISYGEWNASANRTARLLQKLGIRMGDRVAALAMNRVELLDLWFACGKLGAIFQPLNWRMSPLELLDAVADSEPAALAFEDGFGAAAEELRSKHPRLRTIELDSRQPARDASMEERAGLSAEPLEPAFVRPDSPWVLCSTGGTTGAPKSAVLTHGSIAANAAGTVASWGLRPDDVAPLNAPLFHTGGMNVFTSPLVLIGGASIVCRSFDAEQLLGLVARQEISLLFGVPAMFVALQEHPRWKETDFSGLRLAISGGAPCPLPVFERFFERGVEFRTGYGLTEAGPNNFALPAGEVRKKPGAVGYPLWQVETRIVREGRDCGSGEVGELWIRGPHVCGGYWRRPEETARTFADGWLRTGDLAGRDAEGCHWIAGRSKELIISGGENVYPAEVENVLAAHPGVAEVAVIGAADPKWGEVPIAFVVRRAAQEISPEGLIHHCQERLARYKAPREIIFAGELPKTAAGKIDRRALRRHRGGGA